MDIANIIEWHASRARGRWVPTITRRTRVRHNVDHGFVRKVRSA